MLLEGWWSGICLAPWRVNDWENHNRDGSHCRRPRADKYPGDEREAGKTDEQALRRLWNQMIQEFGHTSATSHRVLHTILLRLFYPWCLHGNISQQVSC